LAPRSRGGGIPDELNRIRNEINRIFEDPFGFVSSATSFFEGWEPSLDIYEDQDRVTVRAELPGMRKEDISIMIEGNTLTISGERKREDERKEGETYRAERYFGRFLRSVTLPQPVEQQNIQATYKDGVLTVTLPKSEEAKRKQITVNAS
jgi:HSP20 family protein